jgi:hypothetical protein
MTNATPVPISYVLGTNDAGSTLLAFILDSHPDICSVGEPPKRTIQREGKTKACSCGTPFAACPFWRDIARMLEQKGIPFSQTAWPNDYRYSSELAHRLLTRYHPSSSFIRRAAEQIAELALPRHRRRMAAVDRGAVEFARAVLNKTNKRVFVDTGKHLFRFERFRRVPELDLTVIRLVRDVRWFVYTKKTTRSAAAAATQWRVFQVDADRVLSTFPAEKQLVVRYEDICSDPPKAARRLHEFLGVEPAALPAVFDPARHHISGDGIGGPFAIRNEDTWRAGLTEVEQQTALRIAGDVNERFGYV